MRLPLVQILLFFYFVGLAITAFKTKRKFIWSLALFVLVALAFNITLLFINPGQVIVNKGGIASVLALVLRFPFIFLLLSFALCIEALLTRERTLIILASSSVFIIASLLLLLSLSGM